MIASIQLSVNGNQLLGRAVASRCAASFPRVSGYNSYLPIVSLRYLVIRRFASRCVLTMFVGSSLLFKIHVTASSSVYKRS